MGTVNMGLMLCSFGSGSSGNCYLVRSREKTVLIDAGISTKRIHNGLSEIGVERSSIDGVFITHEHTDHVKGLRVLTKQNPNWKVYATGGTGECIAGQIRDPEQLSSICAGEEIRLGDMTIRPISVSHDAADPVCYSITSGDASMLIMTDTGYVPQEAASCMKEADLIVLEANHEIDVLKAGPYPYHLKRRILGDRGHLSNETAGETLADCMSGMDRYRQIFLAHLSRENNFPLLAEQTVKNILEEHGFYPGRDYSINVMKREGLSGIAEI